MQTREIKFFPLSELNEHADAYRASKKREIIYSSTDPKYLRPSSKPIPEGGPSASSASQAAKRAAGMPAFVTYRGEMQIIACRNARACVRLSLAMAMRIAYSSRANATGFVGSGYVWDSDPRFRPATPEELLVNPKPTRVKFNYKAKRGEPNAWKNSEDAKVLYVNSFASDEFLCNELGLLQEKGLVHDRLGIPMAMVDTPYGTWPEKLEEVRNLIRYNQFSVVVINAFELVTMTARQKHDLSFELLRLQDEFNVTVIVFTTEVRKEMKAGIYGRGPIGRLQCLAGSVIKIEGDGEHLFDATDEGWETWTQKANEIMGFAKPPVEPIEEKPSDQPAIADAFRNGCPNDEFQTHTQPSVSFVMAQLKCQ
jgi:hypothetical protein